MGKSPENNSEIENELSRLVAVDEHSPASFELSDLEKQAVIDKMCDIATPGVAYKELSGPDDIVTKVFKEGILGGSYRNARSGDYDAPITADNWAKTVHKNKNSLVFFNISGRTRFEASFRNLVHNSDPEMKYYLRSSERIGGAETFIVFDLDSYKERPSFGFGQSDTEHHDQLINNQRGRSFIKGIDELSYRQIPERPNHPLEYYEEHNRKAPAAYGFALSYRVPPRFFKGVVILDTPLKEAISVDERRSKFLEWLSESSRELSGWKYESRIGTLDYTNNIRNYFKEICEGTIKELVVEILRIKKCQDYENVNFFTQAEVEWLKSFVAKTFKTLFISFDPETTLGVTGEQKEKCEIMTSRCIKLIVDIFLGIRKEFVLIEDPNELSLWQKSKAEDILKEMFQGVGEKKDRLVPIYDGDGNMLWPERISHEDIVKIEEEKKTKKEE